MHEQETLSSRRVELVLDEMDTLPTLPAVATHLLRIVNDDEADIRELVRTIEADPALTAKVLSLCRRATLGIGTAVTSVERAVVLLGFDAVRSLILSVQIFDWMNRIDRRGPEEEGGQGQRRSGGASGFDKTGFWRHSIGVACCAEQICRQCPGRGLPRPEEAFVAGLVHDLGKLALALVLPKAYRRLCAEAEHNQANIADMERSVIGLDHQTVGKRLAERWELPGVLRDVIWLHGYDPSAAPSPPNGAAIGVVRLADALCRRLHLGWSGNFDLRPTPEEICGQVGVPPEVLGAVEARLHAVVSERCRDLGLADEPSEQLLIDSLLTANKRLGSMASALQDRSRIAQQQLRALRAVAAFHGGVRPGWRTRDALEAVVRSACDVLGAGLFATVHQQEADEDCVLTVHNPDGGARVNDVIGRPPRPDGRRSEGSRGSGVPGAAMGLVETDEGALSSWLCGHLEHHHPEGKLVVVPLYADGRSLAVLAHDRDVSRIGGRHLSALRGAWSSAVGVAVRHEQAARMGERLAQANAALLRAQDELAEAQAMARLGELTAGAAHEMNNPLAVISGRAQELSRRASSAQDRGAASAIVGAARRLSELITRLHLIATPPEPRPSVVALADLVNGAIRLAREQSGGPGQEGVVPVQLVMPAPLPPARVDRDLLGRALAEVIANAIESRPRTAVDVRVGSEGPKGALVIEVEDTGVGMSERALRHAFDPFFSEKPAGRQTGLGLATARRLIGLHNGTLTLRSEEGKGTLATVTLHRWRAEVEAGPGVEGGRARAA